MGECEILVLAYPGSSRQRVIKRLCVCVCVVVVVKLVPAVEQQLRF